MPALYIMIPSLALGVIVATWGRGGAWWKLPEDRVLVFLGFVLGAIIGWSVVEPWFILGLIVVSPLIIWRRKRPARPRQA